MVLKIFTKDDFEETREAKELGARLSEIGYEVEYFDSEDAHVTSLIDLYDIYSYPTFLVVTEDGMEIQCWRGQVPLESDIKQFMTE